jgi:hypothetical protein
VVGVGLALIAVYYFAVQPFLDYRARLDKEHTALTQKLAKAKATIAKAARERGDWEKLVNVSLKSNPSEASLQAQENIGVLAMESGLQVTAMRPAAGGTAIDDKSAFPPQTLQVTGLGALRAVAHLLYRLEKDPPFPVKVTQVTLSPHEKEGQDNLQLQLTIATANYNPAAEAPKAPARSSNANTPR